MNRKGGIRARGRELHSGIELHLRRITSRLVPLEFSTATIEMHLRLQRELHQRTRLDKSRCVFDGCASHVQVSSTLLQIERVLRLLCRLLILVLVSYRNAIRLRFPIVRYNNDVNKV